MDSIIFCGGCGTFISAAEMSAGQASKVNNLYYCQKCTTGKGQATAARPAPAAQPARPATRPAVPTVRMNTGVQQPAKPSQVRSPTPAARPAQPVPVQRPPAATARPAVLTVRMNTGVQPSARPSQVRPATPVARPTQPVPVQRPPVVPARPVQPAAVQPVKAAMPVRPNQTRPMAPIGRPAKLAPNIRRPAVAPRLDEGIDNGMEEAADALRRPQAKAKGGIKKMYLIAGGAAVALIIGVLVFMSMSSAAKEKEEAERQNALKKCYNQIVEADRDYPDDPKKALEVIQKQAGQLKGTPYEEKVKELEAELEARAEIADKIKELEVPTDTAEEIGRRITAITDLMKNKAVNDKLEKKMRGMLSAYKKQQKDIEKAEEQRHKALEAEEQKAYDEFQAKVETLKKQNAWKEVIRECEKFMKVPVSAKYQDEVNSIKDAAQATINEHQAKIERQKQWQTLSDDSTKWERTGDSKTEFYVDGDNRMILTNPNSAGNRGAVTTISNNNEGEGWKDFTMTVEFKVIGGTFEMMLRGGTKQVDIPGYGKGTYFTGVPLPFPRKFKDEWQRYTIEMKGKKLTITGSDLTEPKVAEVPEGTGAIGINVKGGDNIIVKELKVKIIG